MRLHDDLLQLALALSESESQASSRRSASTAYYALFHRLAFEAAQLFFPQLADASLQAETVRALDHKTMKQVCQWFSGSATSNKPVRRLLGDTAIPNQLKELSRAFIRLQEVRHEADYNVEAEIPASEAREMCAQAQAAFLVLDAQRDEPIYRIFLGSLLFANLWRG